MTFPAVAVGGDTPPDVFYVEFAFKHGEQVVTSNHEPVTDELTARRIAWAEQRDMDERIGFKEGE